MDGGKRHFFITRYMVRELLFSRELIWRLFLRDFSAKYRQSILGIFWAVLLPIITVSIFVGMHRSGLFVIGETGVPYPLYALIGLTIWNIFSIGLSVCSQSLVNAGSIIVKINFSKTALPIAASGQSIFEFIIRLALILVAFIYYGISPDWSGFFLGLIAMMPLYLLMLGMGFVFSLIAGIYRDMANVLPILLMVILLTSPVLYPIQGDGTLVQFNRWNPFNYLVNVPRDLILHGSSSLLLGYLISSAFSLMVFYLGWRFLFLAQMRIAERI